MNCDVVLEIGKFIALREMQNFFGIISRFCGADDWKYLLLRDFNISLPNSDDAEALYINKYRTQLRMSDLSKQLIDSIINDEEDDYEFYGIEDDILDIINNAIINNETILFPLYIMVGYEGDKGYYRFRDNARFNIVNVTKGILDIRYYMSQKYIVFKESESKIDEYSFKYLQQILLIPALYKVLNRNIVDKERVRVGDEFIFDDEYVNTNIDTSYIFYYNGKKFYPINIGHDDNVTIPVSLDSYINIKENIRNKLDFEEFYIIDDNEYERMIMNTQPHRNYSSLRYQSDF